MNGIGKPNNKMPTAFTGIESTIDENSGVNYVGSVDNVDFERGLIRLSGFEAGPGITLALVDGIIDADGDTRLSVEKTPDNDTLTLDIGDNSGNYSGLANQLSWSTASIDITGSNGVKVPHRVRGGMSQPIVS